MLSSINPLGERARRQRWWLTVTFYVIGGTAGGALIGVAAGAIGALLPPGAWRAPAAVAAGLMGAAWDLRERPVPSPHRQVDENWLPRYRNWVYGLGFGMQLGSGVATIVVTAAVYTWLAFAFLMGSPAIGALIGSVFGLVRSAVILQGRSATDPAALRAMMSGLQQGRPFAHRLVVGAQIGAALLVAAGWMIEGR
jgi:MFS family permease